VPTKTDSVRVAELMSRLRAAVDEAVDYARSVGGLVGLVEDYFRHRVQLASALETLKAVEPRERDRVLREAQLAYVRHERSFIEAPGGAGLLRAWNGLLLEATAKVSRDRSDAEKYAAVAADEDDDDRAWVEAAGQVGADWKDE
jgi:hypothetical protein